MLQLKRGQERFVVVDGPLAGREYEPGRQYEESQVPEMDKDRFETVPTVKAAPEKAAKGGTEQ